MKPRGCLKGLLNRSNTSCFRAPEAFTVLNLLFTFHNITVVDVLMKACAHTSF